MAEGYVTRKLTAILYADVAGYSRLTGEDEVGTHEQLSAGLDVISNGIEAGGGRVVHYAGDAVLAEFGSIVTAVQTAIEANAAEVTTAVRARADQSAVRFLTEPKVAPKSKPGKPQHVRRLKTTRSVVKLLPKPLLTRKPSPTPAR